MKIRIIENILLEATPEEKYKQYKQLIDDYEVYIKIVGADPTSLNDGELVKFGNYSNWLLKLYLNNKLQLEDLYKATEYLTIFDKFKKTLEIKERDISLYKSLPDLYKVLNDNELFDKTTKRDIRRAVHSGKDDIELIYEDSNILVVVPLTKEASCYWGTGTEWCTATRDFEVNMFDEYNKKDKLYIIINKHNDKEKYQFHFFSNMFMDISDEYINLYDFFFNSKIYKPLIEVFYDKFSLDKWEFKIDDGVATISVLNIGDDNDRIYKFYNRSFTDNFTTILNDNIDKYDNFFENNKKSLNLLLKYISQNYSELFSNDFLNELNITDEKSFINFMKIHMNIFKKYIYYFNDDVKIQIQNNFLLQQGWENLGYEFNKVFTEPEDVIKIFCYPAEYIRFLDQSELFDSIDEDVFNVDMEELLDNLSDISINNYINSIEGSQF